MTSWRRLHPLVFVTDLDAPELDDADERHLRKSLRMLDGDPLTVSDGVGRWVPARLGSTIEVVGEQQQEPAPKVALTVGFTPVKGQKPEWIVQKLTELGMQRIVPLLADRSVVRWDDARADKQFRRWSRVIREAAMQSRQVRLPTFEPMTAVADALRDLPQAAMADPDGAALGVDTHTVLIGPEGGWSDAERAIGDRISLPGGVLRAETACVVAGAMLAAIRGGFHKSPD